VPQVATTVCCMISVSVNIVSKETERRVSLSPNHINKLVCLNNRPTKAGGVKLCRSMRSATFEFRPILNVLNLVFLNAIEKY